MERPSLPRQNHDLKRRCFQSCITETIRFGFDILSKDGNVISDADARALATHVDADTVIVLSFTRGQGFLIGRPAPTPQRPRRLSSLTEIAADIEAVVLLANDDAARENGGAAKVGADQFVRAAADYFPPRHAWDSRPPAELGFDDCRIAVAKEASHADLFRDWIAEEGSFVYEPPGEVHTLTVPADCAEMITFFNISGAMIYLDADGGTIGYEDVFTKLEMCRRHYTAVGLGADYVDAFVR